MKRKTLLAMAVALLCSVGSWAQASPTAGVAVAPGEYYIYNLGSEMYLSKGSTYGTHATVDGAGCVVTISGTEDAYALHFAGIDAAKYLGDGGWTDNATSSYTWSFESETVDGYSNVYKIKDNDKGTYLYWFAGSGVDWANEVMVGEMPATLPNGYFILIPRATRESIASASTSNIVDVTYLLTDPDIEASVNSLKWSGDFQRQNSAHAGYSGNYLEKWVDSKDALGNFSAYQTLSLPAGTYRFTMAATAERQGQSIEITGAYIYAGNQQTAVSSTNTYTVDFTTNGAPIQIGMKTVSTNANWVNFDKARLYCLGIDYSTAFVPVTGYASQGSAPTGGHTYVLYNETGKSLYNDGVTPRISSSNATFYTLETTGSEFYIHSDAGLLYKQSNSNWNTWTDGAYGDVAKWSTTLSDGKYKIQNHNKAQNTYYFAPNSNGEGIQCYSDKTALTGWYFIDVTNKNVAISLLYALQQVKASVYATAEDGDAKVALGEALNRVYITYVLAPGFNSTTYDEGEAAIQTAVDDFYSALFASLTGSEGGADITSWITNPTPTTNGDGWDVSGSASYNSGNNVAEFYNQGAKSISQTISMPAGYYRLTNISLTRTGMAASLALTGATSGALNSMNIVTVGSGEVNNLSSANTWFNAGYGVNELDFYVPTKQDVTISLTSDNTTGDHWMVWRSFQLTAVGNSEGNLLNLEKYLDNAALTSAKAARDDEAYTHVVGDEKSNLRNAIDALDNHVDGEGTVAEKVAARKPLKYALVAPYNAFYQTSVKNAYNEYFFENETATRLDADASGVSVPTTAAAASTAAHEINVINYNQFLDAEYADVSATALGAWTDDNVVSRTGQHWSGSGSEEYFEQNSGWGSATVWKMSRQQTISLAAGSYVLKVAARVSSGADAQLSVKVGDGEPIVTYSGHHGDSGLGITTSGEACYISHDTDDTKVYANSNNGRGFEWRYIPFTLASTGDVTLKFYAENTSGAMYQYVSFCNLGIWTDPKVAARTELLTAINNATSTRKIANEGTGAFQVPTVAGEILAGAINDAQDVYDDDEADLATINGATSAMNEATATYEATTLNAPSSSTHYYLKVLTSGHAKEGNAIVTSLGSTSDNNPSGYSFNASAAPAAYLAQAVTFTSADDIEHPNRYYITFEGPQGTLYLTNGTNNGSQAGHKAAQIQGNTDPAKKMGFDITPSSMANGFHIYNTETETAVACEEGGALYTNGIETDFTIAEATQASVPVTLSSGKYGTRIFPFTPSAIDGITYYSCETINESDLKLDIVEVPAANTPYILYASKDVDETLEGWGTAATTSYESGLLTGIYNTTTIAADAHNYVLQTLNGVQAFYLVKENFTNTQPYRAYITYEAPVEVKALNFIFDELPTVVNSIEAAQNENAVIYNLAGQRLNKAQKGVNIINGKKVLVK